MSTGGKAWPFEECVVVDGLSRAACSISVTAYPCCPSRRAAVSPARVLPTTSAVRFIREEVSEARSLWRSRDDREGRVPREYRRRDSRTVLCGAKSDYTRHA